MLARFPYLSWWEFRAKVGPPAVQNPRLNLEGKIGNVTNLTRGLGTFLVSCVGLFFRALPCYRTPRKIMHNVGICLIQKHSVARSN